MGESSKYSPETFLLIRRVYADDSYRPSREDVLKASPQGVVECLSLTHHYYKTVALKELAVGIMRMIEGCDPLYQKSIWRFYTSFEKELLEHFTYEEANVFPYAGQDSPVPADSFEKDHSGVEETLQDLRNIVVEHLPKDADQQEAFNVIRQINALADDIKRHIILEETLLEERWQEPADDESDVLSPREKEILVCVAKGMLNKEIADVNNISIHTVITHRKNITRKTGIKTVAGLTAYALLNNLIDINSIE